MKIKHLIVTRLALKWRFSETNLSWNEWLSESIDLMNKYCRNSLKNQTNQDFTLISLVDESVNSFGDQLENEIIIKVKSKDNNYPKVDMIKKINDYVLENKYDAVIMTRLDRDDCLRNDYVDNLKKYFTDNKEKYIDLNHSFTFDSKRNKTHQSQKYYKNNFVSPFVTTFEYVKNENLRCISLLVDHTDVFQYLVGQKVDDLYAMQVIHGKNLSNKLYGSETEINLKEYGQ